MKFKFLLVLGLSFCARMLFAQDPPRIILASDQSTPLCSYTETRLPGEISGRFNSNNKFYIETRSYSENELLGRYEAVFKDGNFVATINEDKTGSYNQVYLKVVSTSPVTESGVTMKTFMTRGEIKLVRRADIGDTINAGTTVGLIADMSTNNAVRITLNDSTIYNTRREYFAPLLPMLATQSTEVFIARAVNSCNVPIPVSGRLKVVVNPISIMPGKVSSKTLCEGNDIDITYSVTGGSIPESATFRLRYLVGSNPEATPRQTFEVAAQRKGNGLLTAKIPVGVVKDQQSMRVAILADGPKLVSPYSDYFNVYSKPTASFSSASETVDIGNLFFIRLNVSGPAPHTVELSDGKSYLLDQNYAILLYPTKTETFSIRSLKTSCGVTTDLPKQSIVATVPAGIRINAQGNQKWEICENHTLRLPFVSNAPLNANTKYVVEGVTAKNTIYEFEAKLVNDSLEFFIPHSPSAWVEEGYFSIQKYRVKTANPAYASEYRYDLTIRGIPRIGYETSQSTTLPYPGNYEYRLNVYGGAPIGVLDEKGEKNYAEYFAIPGRIYVPATGDYGPKMAENSCYSASDLPRLKLTVNTYKDTAPVIVVHSPAKSYYCKTDSIEVIFDALGTFGAGNEFKLRTRNEQGESWITIGKPGKYKIPASMLDEGSYSYLQVKSTNPEVTGAAGSWHIVTGLPELPYRGEIEGTTAERPRIFDIEQRPQIYTQMYSAAPYTTIFSDGKQDYQFVQKLQYDAFYPPMPRSKVSLFTLKSITNVCGTTDFNIPIYMYWQAYNLSIDYFAGEQRFCAGEQLTIPFRVSRGTAPAGTVYHLQLGKDNADFQTIASNSSGVEFKYVIPENLEGNYYLRIISDAGIETQQYGFQVNKKPTASITLAEGYHQELNYGENVRVNVKLTGGGPWNVVLDGVGELSFNQDEVVQDYQPAKGNVFRIKTVSNQCGYGEAAGSVAVKVKPKVVEFATQRANICSGNLISVSYHVEGDLPAGGKVGFYLINSNGARFELPEVSATSGFLNLPISSELAGGMYKLFCFVPGTDALAFQEISISKAPEIAISGTTTITPGESTFLQIRRTTEGNAPVNITLSDGTTGTLLSFNNVLSLQVTPAATTNYTITSAQTTCGPAKAEGNALVTVGTVSARNIRIDYLDKFTLCERDTVAVFYKHTGVFSNENQFSLQVLDNLGHVVRSIPATGKQSPLKVVIPTGFSISEQYRIRIAATDPNTSSSDYSQTVTFGVRATAAFLSGQAQVDESKKAKAVVILTGNAPWRYTYGSDFSTETRYSDSPADTLIFTSSDQTSYFQLKSVDNACGAGTIVEPSLFKVEIVLGTEQPGDLLSFGPNPSSALVLLHFASKKDRQFSLYNVNGMRVMHYSAASETELITLLGLPAGTYILNIEGGKEKQVLKIVKP